MTHAERNPVWADAPAVLWIRYTIRVHVKVEIECGCGSTDLGD